MDDWEPQERRSERHSASTGNVREIAETQCRPCKGHGALFSIGPSGETIAQRVRDVTDRKRLFQLRAMKYRDEQIAPCPNCDGIGWVRADRLRHDRQTGGA